MELQTLQILQAANVYGYRRISANLWLRGLDNDPNNLESVGWLLHPYAEVSPQRQLETASMTNKELYGDLPKLTHKICVRRKRFAGHCYRSKNEPVSKTVLWTPKHGARRRGKPATSYRDTLCKDTGLEVSELGTAMEDRSTWRTFVTRKDNPE